MPTSTSTRVVANITRKAKPRGALTDATAKQAKPAEAPYKLADGNSHYLLANVSGSKLWRWKYRAGVRLTWTQAAGTCPPNA